MKLRANKRNSDAIIGNLGVATFTLGLAEAALTQRHVLLGFTLMGMGAIMMLISIYQRGA